MKGNSQSKSFTSVEDSLKIYKKKKLDPKKAVNFRILYMYREGVSSSDTSLKDYYRLQSKIIKLFYLYILVYLVQTGKPYICCFGHFMIRKFTFDPARLKRASTIDFPAMIKKHRERFPHLSYSEAIKDYKINGDKVIIPRQWDNMDNHRWKLVWTRKGLNYRFSNYWGFKISSKMYVDIDRYIRENYLIHSFADQPEVKYRRSFKI